MMHIIEIKTIHPILRGYIILVDINPQPAGDRIEYVALQPSSDTESESTTNNAPSCGEQDISKTVDVELYISPHVPNTNPFPEYVSSIPSLGSDPFGLHVVCLYDPKFWKQIPVTPSFQKEDVETDASQ